MAQQIGYQTDAMPIRSPTCGHCHTQNEQKGSGGCGEEQTDVMTVLIRPQSEELLWKAGQKPTS